MSQTLQAVGGPRWSARGRSMGRGTSVPEPAPGRTLLGPPVQPPAQHTQAALPPSSARQDAAARRPPRALVLTHIHDYWPLAGRMSEATSLLYE